LIAIDAARTVRGRWRTAWARAVGAPDAPLDEALVDADIQRESGESGERLRDVLRSIRAHGHPGFILGDARQRDLAEVR